MPLDLGPFCRVFVNVGSETADDGFEVCVRRDPGTQWPRSVPSIRLVCEDREAVSAVVNALKADGFTRFVGEGTDGPLFQYVPATREDLGHAIGCLSPSGPASVTLIVRDVSDEVMAERVADARSALRQIRSRVPA